MRRRGRRSSTRCSRRTRRCQPIIELQEELHEGARQAEAHGRRAAEVDDERSRRRVEGVGRCRSSSRRSRRSRRSTSATTRSTRARPRGRRRRARRRAFPEREKDSRDGVRGAQVRRRPRDDPQREASASTAAASTDVRPITCEVGVLPRTHGSALFTRGETQALVVDHARHVVRRAEDRRADRRALEALHAALQLPAVRVGEAKSCAAPAGARSATARSPSARSSPVLPDEDEVPVHDPHRLRGPRVERLVLDGHGLRRHAVADGRRRADQGARSPASPWASSRKATRFASSPTSSATRTTSATWTSRSPARRRASPPSRWTSRSAASRARSCAQALEQARDGRLHILGKMSKAISAARAPRLSAVRAAHHDASRSSADQIRDVIGPGGKIIRAHRRGDRRARSTSRTTARSASPRPTARRCKKAHRDHPAPHRRGRGRQDLQGHGPQDHGLRRLRRDPARHRRPRAHLELADERVGSVTDVSRKATRSRSRSSRSTAAARSASRAARR